MIPYEMRGFFALEKILFRDWGKCGFRLQGSSIQDFCRMPGHVRGRPSCGAGKKVRPFRGKSSQAAARCGGRTHKEEIMARILQRSPAAAGRTAGSLAEAYVEELLSALPDDYTIIGGVTVLDRSGERALTELDFVVITPLGAACVLEVKSGSPEESASGELLRHYEAQNGVKSISEQLARQGAILASRMKSFGERVIFSHFLVLPNGTLSAHAEVLNHLEGRVFDSTRLESLCEAILALNEKARAEGVIVDARALERFFVSHYTYRPDAGAICDALAAARRRKAAGIASWVPCIHTSLPLVVVEAPAGAGKTLLAQRLLREAGERREKAVYLNFSRNPAEAMLKSGAGVRASFVGTWHELACECEGRTRDVAALSPEQARDYFSYCSELLMRALAAKRYCWDCIIVDNAEGFMPEWLQALAQALSGRGRLYVLGDPYARIFDGRESAEFDPDQTLLIRTDETLRVPQRQAEELRAFRLVGESFTSASPLEGDSTFIAERYSGPDSLFKATRRTLEQFLSRGFRPEQIALLSWHGWRGSDTLSREVIGGCRLRRPLDAFDANNMRVFTEGEIYCDTLRRCCGFSAPCVIITEMDFEAVTEREKALLYLAMTRAEAALAFVMSERAYGALSRYLAGL